MNTRSTRNIKINQSNQGFTLVELVVVILILGILAATALPKFMNVSAEAHTAAVAGAGGGLGAGVALAHAQWVANGTNAAETDVANFGDGTVAVNTLGWPTDSTTDATTLSTTAHCINVWTGVMQNPPTVLAGATTADYVVTVSGTQCTFTYNGTGSKSLVYESSNGTVTVNN